MPTRDGTGEFLARARVRARAAAALRVFALAAALLVFVLLGLAWAAHRIGPAAYWPTVTTGVLLAVTLGAAFFGVFRPWRRLKSDTAIARLVGVRHPPLASDLLSAVQLEGLVSPGEAPASQALVKAFRDQVAGAVAHLDLRQVVSFRPAQRAMGLAAGAALVLAVGIWLSPEGLLHGLGLLTRTPTLYEGAAVSDEPLVGDLVLTYHYPAYTGLPPRTVEGATGDVQGLRGTRIDLDMRPLRDARRALLFFGENGERGPLEVAIVDGHLRASFVVAEADRYRVWLAPLLGRPVRERLGHRVEAAADQPPTVDIKAPADRLELPAPRPIEVGFAATDDYGLGLVELVYRVGGGPEKRITLQDGAGSRQAQGTTTWDPSSEALVPGVQIAYRIDAHDTDTVSGPKVGSSRTLFLVLEHPRESSDESLESQRYVLERLIGVLADRLEATDGSRSEVKSRSPLQEWQAFQTAHEDETAQVALLAGLVDEQRREGGGQRRPARSALEDRRPAQP
ncbi:MAG: DUF4175 domain-containing protein [Myxococcales bacterium]|nr:DUF4175 domain-containing protein [Myxococcales bacterium]